MRKVKISAQERLLEEIEAKQRNTVWPDPLRNTRDVDVFLWKGSPDAPLVQRIGAWMFGIAFILCGVGFLAVAYEKQSLAFGILSAVPFLIGVKVCLNGFRKHRRKPSRQE